MKKLLLVFFVGIFFSSCVTTTNLTEIPEESNLFGFDFRPYSEKGFLITPYAYDGNYQAIGLLTYSVTPGAKKEIQGTARNMSGKSVPEYKWIVNEILPAHAIDGIYRECVNMGADALVDFKITNISADYTTNPPLRVSGYEISGFAIKRQ